MSGFDFDALRDPNAPLPSDRARADVDARARQLRGRAHRNRFAAGAAALVATVAIVFGVVATTRDSGPSVSVESPSTTTVSTPTSSPSVAGRFIPPTTIEHGRVVLPVTQPDGATFALRYPPRMRIAQLGFTGGIDINASVGNGGRCCTAEFSYTTVAQVYGDTAPVATYRGAHGESVPLYSHRPYNSQIAPSIAPPRDLAFQFGPWLVEVYLLADQSQNPAPMTEQQIATLARSVTGSEDAHGYLLLHTSAPFSLGDKFFGGFGPAADELNYSASNNVAFDSHIVCGHPPSAVSMDPIATPFLTGTLARGNVQFCVDKVLHVQATGSAQFLTAALHDLDVTPLRSAGATSATTTTTTTTATAASNPVNAVSASWVSPTHGWVLDKSGLVRETTDGGTTWSERSRVEVSSDFNARIRFADALHGFEFKPRSNTPLESTVDGGVHWKQLKTPFTSVSDLAITRGVAYLVGVPATASPSGAFPGFRIWSTPVSRLNWSMDPLVIPVGAGPVPEQTLVFAGDRGWLINNDRDVLSGARLSPLNGLWADWTPPCKDAGGPAEIAASTSTDLVALCSPGFASTSATTYVEFSHNAGTTFRRQVVPGGKFGAGGPLSPAPDSAVIADGSNFRRTTDNGASWHVVANGVSAATIDFGFTTTTQGFVILQDGLMLMTHDAGATWSRVTLR